MSLNRLTLLLNKTYEPINFVSARRAFSMTMKGVARVLRPSKYFIRSAAGPLPIPSVIILENYVRIPHIHRSVSRKSILLRDRLTCQYCLKRFTAGELTLDHVNPRSRDGGNTWENLVAACYKCNNRKGNMTPAEAGMELPRRPAPLGIHAKHRLLAGDEAEWDEFLFC